MEGLDSVIWQKITKELNTFEQVCIPADTKITDEAVGDKVVTGLAFSVAELLRIKQALFTANTYDNPYRFKK